MALLTGPRNTPCKGDVSFKAYPVEAATTIYMGGMVALDSSGYLIPAQPTTGLIVVGVANNVVGGDFGESAVNVSTATGGIPNPPNIGSAGALQVNVGRGTYFFDNAASGAVVQADVGQLVFAVDDHTVTTSTNSAVNPVVGRVVDLTSAGQVEVDMTQQSNASTTAGY